MLQDDQLQRNAHSHQQANCMLVSQDISDGILLSHQLVKIATGDAREYAERTCRCSPDLDHSERGIVATDVVKWLRYVGYLLGNISDIDISMASRLI